MQNVMQALYLTRNARGLPASARRYIGGAPAKVLRELEEKDIYAWERSKQTYIDLAARCKAPGGLKRID